MRLAQRKQSKSGHMYTRIYGRRRPSPYGRLCQSSNPQRYGTGTRITLPYKPYYTVTVRSPTTYNNRKHPLDCRDTKMANEAVRSSLWHEVNAIQDLG